MYTQVCSFQFFLNKIVFLEYYCLDGFCKNKNKTPQCLNLMQSKLSTRAEYILTYLETNHSL